MNWPNIISFSRIPLLFLTMFFMHFSFTGAPTLVAIFYALGANSDWLDGYIARKYNIISNFGKLLDALTDKIFVMGMFVTLLGMGLLHKGAVFAVVIILAREFLVTGIRLVAASKGKVLAAERLGKYKTIAQLLCLSFYLFTYIITTDYAWITPNWLVGLSDLCSLIFLGLATALTIISGVSYTLNNLTLLTEEMER